MELAQAARCMECEWTASGPKADSAAAKHTKETRHSTSSWGTPLKVER